MTERKEDSVIGKADWLTVLCVTPVVEGRENVPKKDRGYFLAWLIEHYDVPKLLDLMRGEDMTRIVFGRLAEEYAWYIETEDDVYACDLMVRTEIDGDGRAVIAEPPTASERMAALKRAVGA